MKRIGLAFKTALLLGRPKVPEWTSKHRLLVALNNEFNSTEAVLACELHRRLRVNEFERFVGEERPTAVTAHEHVSLTRMENNSSWHAYIRGLRSKSRISQMLSKFVCGVCAKEEFKL